MTEVTLLARAQKLAARGIPVFPVVPVKKEPRIKWKAGATTDPEQINDWWQRWPDSWVGVPMGLRTGLLVVDLDDKNGKRGSESFAALVGERELPECPMVSTYSGGVHLYFQHFAGARNSRDMLADGVDVRAEGGLVVAYSDEIPIDPPECPNWLKELILARSSTLSLMPAAEDPYDGQRRALTREELSRAAGARDTPAKRLCGQIYDGVAWGVAGGRSNALTTLRTYLLSTYPDLDPEGTAPLFAESCAAVRATDAGVPRAEETTVEWIAQMLRGGIGYALALRAHEEKLIDEAKRAFPGLTAGAGGPPHDLVAQLGAHYFLKLRSGDYDGPWLREQVPTQARDLFADMPGVALKTKTGASKGAAQLAVDYGTACKDVVYDYAAPRCRLEGTRFIATCAPRAAHEPERNEQIARWLELLGGSAHERLLDWLATFPEVDRATAGLYISGPPAIGKSLLVRGLSRLWECGTACPFPKAISNFNFDLTQSPIIHADENLRLPRHENQRVVDVVKDCVEADRRRVEQKYAARAELRGGTRLLITTNQLPSELFDDTLSTDDIAALDQRILVLVPRAECADYLRSIGGYDATTAWVAGGGVARHVLWLARERGPGVQRGGRFLVEGQGFGDLLVAGDADSRALCLAVLRAWDKPEIVQRDRPGHPGVWVHMPTLRERWRHLSDSPVPEDWKRACSTVCEPLASLVIKVDGHPVRYRAMRPAILAAVRALGQSE